MIRDENDPGAQMSFLLKAEEDKEEAGLEKLQRVPTIISLNLKFNEKHGETEENKSFLEPYKIDQLREKSYEFSAGLTLSSEKE